MNTRSRVSLGTTLAGLAFALVLIFIIAIYFKTSMMFRGEKFKRSCTQGAADAVLASGAAVPGDIESGPSMRASLFSSFPWYSIDAEPKNKFFAKVWSFCNEVLDEEKHANQLNTSMYETAVGSHNISAAQLAAEHIDLGWGIGNDVSGQRKIIQKALGDWGTHGHDTDVQDVLDKYDQALSDPTTEAATSRIVSKGEFVKTDLCSHETILLKHKVVSSTEKLFKSIGCKNAE